MSKLTVPARTKDQFIYDFSMYEYKDKATEKRVLAQVKDITENSISDDGIKEIQLEMLWNSLNEENKKRTKKENSNLKAILADFKRVKFKNDIERDCLYRQVEIIQDDQDLEPELKYIRLKKLYRSFTKPRTKIITPKHSPSAWTTKSKLKNKIERNEIKNNSKPEEDIEVINSNINIKENKITEVKLNIHSQLNIDADSLSLKAASIQVKSAFTWPTTTTANLADGSMPESQWPQMGMLKAVGYSVGSNGLQSSTRLKLLQNVYSEKLPYVESRSYVSEWGEPNTAKRLKKLAETLAAFVRNAKRKNADMSVAIKDWEYDLNWLKDEYYLKHKYEWVWPVTTNDKTESEHIITEKIKSYSNSREFLKEQYTNNAGELCCQICHSALPFKLSNGEYFWEETPINGMLPSSPYSDLILCPTHRAMYIHANKDSMLVINEVENGTTKQIALELAGVNKKLFVTGEHINGLKIQIDNWKQKSSIYESTAKKYSGIKYLNLYKDSGVWVLSTKKGHIVTTLNSKEKALEWLEGFDRYRNMDKPSVVRENNPHLEMKEEVGIRLGGIKKSEPISSYKTGYKMCTVCGGDGGINGGCWKCNGSGWM